MYWPCQLGSSGQWHSHDGSGYSGDAYGDLLQGHSAELVGGTEATLVGTVDRVTELCGRYLEAGVDWLILRQTVPYDLDGLATFASEVIPALSS